MSDVQTSPASRLALVVDDDDVFRERLCRALQARGWEAISAGDGPTALRHAESNSPDLAIVDLRLPGMDGLSIVRQLHEIDETICVLMLTGYGSIATAIEATRSGASHYLTKPVDTDQILSAYDRIVNGESVPPAAATAQVPTLARVEWEHIQRVLADCDGNISQAARLLGLHRRSLQRKLSKYPPRH